MSVNTIAKTNDSQQWSILEKLLLAQCVYKFGEDNWPLISKTLRQNILTNRSTDFFNQKNCSLEYFTMIEELESARRLSAVANTMPSAQDMPPVVKLAKQLYLERMEELKAQIKADEESFRKLVTEIDEIRSGKWDSKLKELFPEVSEPTPMEITNDSQVPDDNSLTTETGGPEVIIHQASAVPDITIPASEEKIDVKAEVEEKPLDTKSPSVPTLVSEAAQTVVESNSNATPLESNTVLADAVALVTTDSSVASNETTLPTPDVNEINGTILTPSNPSSNDVAKPFVDTVIEEQKPSIPEVSAQTIEEKEILSEIEPTPQVTEILAPTAEVTPAVTPKESEIKQDISIKRKPDDIEMMSVDNSPKRARTQSRSPSVTAEPTIEAMSPAIETPHAETPVAETPGTGADHAPAETPERKEETPVAAVEEVQDIDHNARIPDTPEGSVSVASNAANSTVTTPGPSTSDRKKGPSSRELEQRQKSWLKNINLLWSEISNHKNGAMFMNPIKENIAPRYYEIVKRPMDLKQIKQRIRDGTIRNTMEFERDILLMLTNSLIYNKEGTEVYQMALEMLEDVQEQIRVFKTADAYSSTSNVPKDPSHGLRRRSIVSDGGSIQGDADTA